MIPQQYLYKAYGLMGNPDTPNVILTQMVEIVKMLNDHNFTLRTTTEKIPDNHVAEYATRKEIYTPWKKFDPPSRFCKFPPEAEDVAKIFAPSWPTKPAAQLFLQRNVGLVLGPEMNSPIHFMICWTQDGAEHVRDRSLKTGYTGHIIAVTSGAHIPVFNLQHADARQRLDLFLTSRHL